MDWERARRLALEKWAVLAELAAARKAAELRDGLVAGCAFCEAAQGEIDALGIPKVKMYPCDFCRGYLDYGGCQEPLDRILKAIDRGDWATVDHEVKLVRGLLAAMGEAA